MKRSIPLRTMGDISRMQRKRRKEHHGIRIGSSIDLGALAKLGRQIQPRNKEASEEDFPTHLFNKPRNWAFQTKPQFKKIRGPLIDVFHEAEEVLIVVDLGGFQRGDITLNMSPEKYSITAKRGDQVFREVINLPEAVDFEKSVEQFRNSVLEIVLPRKKHR